MRINFIQKMIDKIRRKNEYLIKISQGDYSKIKKTEGIIGHNGFKIKKVNLKTREVIYSNGSLSILSDFDYPWIVREVFGQEVYKFHKDINQSNNYTVFDIGANRGYASLYFAQKDYVKEIYAFELVPQTAKLAERNININPKYKNKINLYSYGFGKDDCVIQIKRLEHRDGCNTINPDFIDSYMPEEKGKGSLQDCQLRRASKVLKDLIKNKNIGNIILKIDVEGAEYDIIDDLVDNFPEIFNKIVKIVGETHLGFDRFYDKIKRFGYEVIWKEPHDNGTCPFELSKIGN